LLFKSSKLRTKNMVDFRPRHLNRRDQLLYAVPRKDYTRTHEYPKNTMRIPVLEREKAFVIKARNLGYPTNMLSRVLGRSTSFIHRILKTAVQRLSIRKIDMRKLPSIVRLRCAAIRWNSLLKYWPLWEAWICGLGEKPP
jgi:hypothetical protein